MVNSPPMERGKIDFIKSIVIIYGELWTNYSVIEIEHYRFKGRDHNGKSVIILEKELNFYLKDFSDVDLSIDWRTMEIINLRKEGIFLGTITNPSFPIKYPLKLDNGHICEAIYASVDSNELDYNENL